MSKTFLVLILACTLCAMAGEAAGQIYKWVDEKGTVHFSETPTSEDLKPQGKQNSKEHALEIVTGVETRGPSKEEVLIEYRKQRDREQDAREETKRAEQERRLKATEKATKDQQEEMQLRRDIAADKLEKEAKKFRNSMAGVQMLQDAARLRAGFDLEAPPPPPSEGVHELPGAAIDSKTGQIYPRIQGAIINPRTGEFYPDVGVGYTDPKTGGVIPKN